MTTRLIDEAVYHAQTKPGSLTNIAGGKKGLDRLITYLLGHADTGVDHR
jgi:hypothetical protein